MELLAPTADLRAMPLGAARIAVAIRLSLAFGQTGRDPIAPAADRLGSRAAALALNLFLAQVGAAWPDPVRIHPACCPRLSHDEALLIDMVGLADAGDRRGFDRLLCEMLPFDTRERLFDSARRLAEAMAD